jgi:hypothetical protein
MPRRLWGIAAALMAIGGLTGTATASAGSGLSLSISSPRIEGAPITFTASGVAGGSTEGESNDFLLGAVLHQSSPCPSGGADEFDAIPGGVVQTLDAFPIGPFDLSARVTPSGNAAGTNAADLLAGAWRECVYLEDRDTDDVVASGQMDFTTRKAHVAVRVLAAPRHVKFAYDPLGRPLATETFVVRARSEVPMRTVQIGIERPGQHLACTGDMRDAKVGLSNPYRVTAGPARTYRVSTTFLFPAGPMPYGKRVRVCAVLAYASPDENGDHYLEGAAVTSMVLRP